MDGTGGGRRGVRAGLRIGSGLATVLACLTLGAMPAAAQEECGAAAGGGATCGAGGNPYPAGITYTPVEDFRLAIDPAVLIAPDAGLPGVTLSGDAGAIALDVDPSAAIATQGATGVSVTTGAGAIDVRAAGAITTTGDAARGIDVYSNSGAVNVVASGTVRTAGYASTAIHVLGYYGDVSVTSGTIEVSGPGSRGLYAASTGAVTVDSGSITMTGDNDSPTTALLAVGYSATVVRSGHILTTGSNSDGLTVQSIGGDADVTSGTVETRGPHSYGVFGEEFYDGTFHLVSDTVTTMGDRSVGITVTGPGGAVDITSGTVTTQGAGATGITTRYVEAGALTSVGGDIAIASGAVSTAGAGADAIVADTTGGGITITSGTVATAGAGSRGLVAYAPAGPVTITSGSVATQGDGAIGILVEAGGDVTLSGKGNVATSGADAPAITVATAGHATLDLGSVTTRAASSDGVVVDAAEGSTIALAGTTRAGSGIAVRAAGGTVSLSNAGSLTGGIVLGAGDDRFVNAGTFAATVDSDFGAGTDSFVNTGRLVASGTVTFANLESTANSGTISLQNGHVGDRLLLPGTWAGSGASRLLVDVGAGGTDTLQTGVASGSTAIGIALLGTPQLGSAGTVVAAAPGTPAAAFTLDAATVAHGLIAYGLAYDAATGRFDLVGAPGAAAYRTARFAEGERSTWYRLSDGWAAHVAAMRDGGAGTAKRGGWFTLGGGTDRRDGTLGGSLLGVATRYSTGYRQDGFTVIGGYDLTLPAAAGSLTAGVLGAYQTSHLTFAGSADAVSYQSATGGLYTGWSGGAVFANALGRYQKSWNTIYARSAGYGVKRDGDLYGATGEVGVRFGNARVFAEPVATIDWVHTSLGGYDALGARFRFDTDDGLRGKAGLRVGARVALGASTGTFYAGGAAVHEFQGRDRVAMTSGGTTAILRGDRIGTYGEGRIGFSAVTPGGVTGFLEALGDASKHYHGGGGRAGLAFRF